MTIAPVSTLQFASWVPVKCSLSSFSAKSQTGQDGLSWHKTILLPPGFGYRVLYLGHHKWAARLSRCVALKTYQTLQAWTYFKKDAIELWQYWNFRFRMCTSNGWPFRPLAKLLSWGVKNSHGFGTFDSNRDGLTLPANHPIFDPQNDRLFSKEAAIRAFGHVKVADVDEKSSADPPVQTEAEALIRVQAQLAEAIKVMQKADARRVTRWKAIAVITVLAVIALGVLLFTQ
jgi:hypothetical protein